MSTTETSAHVGAMEALAAERERFFAEVDAASGPMAPCPSWCTLRPGHGWDSISDGRALRGHGWPEFGPHVSGGADEYQDEGGRLRYSVSVEVVPALLTDPAELRQLAAEVTAAAEWLGAHA